MFYILTRPEKHFRHSCENTRLNTMGTLKFTNESSIHCTPLFRHKNEWEDFNTDRYSSQSPKLQLNTDGVLSSLLFLSLLSCGSVRSLGNDRYEKGSYKHVPSSAVAVLPACVFLLQVSLRMQLCSFRPGPLLPLEETSAFVFITPWQVSGCVLAMNPPWPPQLGPLHAHTQYSASVSLRAKPVPSSFFPVLQIAMLRHFLFLQLSWDSPRRARPYHPKCTLYIASTYSIVRSMRFDKGIMTCIHHDSVIQNSLAALKILYVLPIYLCPLPHTHKSRPPVFLSFLHSFAFSIMTCSWNYTVYNLLRLASFNW